MSNRLLIKSVLCANSNGIYEMQIVNEGESQRRELVKVRDRVKFSKSKDISYVSDIRAKTLTLTQDGKSEVLPIDDYSLSLADRE